MSKRRLALGVVAVGLLAVVVTLKDAVRARVFALGCRLGSGDACFKGALLYRHADSTALLKRGCEALAHVDSCMALTDAIAVGIAGPPDFAHAEKMCLEGDRRFSRACLQMAEETIRGQFGDYEQQERAETFFKRACALGSAAGCNGVDGVAARVAESKRVAAIYRACAIDGDAPACVEMNKRVDGMVEAFRRASAN